jgi:mercuric ion transport protein
MLNRISVPLISVLLAGIAASACCVGPLILLLLGFGGAWIGSLTALEPYRPIFIAIALVALLVAYQSIFRARQKQSCGAVEVCAQPHVNTVYKRLYIGVLIAVFIFIISPYLVPLIYV